MKLNLRKYLIVLFALALAISISAKTVAVPIDDIHKDTVELIDRAKQLYLNEQYSQASRVWQQAVTAFEGQKDVLNQSMALSNLALTQQKLGNLTAAEKAIADSLKLIKTQSQTEEQQNILAHSLEIEGTIARSRGEFRLAFETWQQAEKIYQKLDNDRSIIKNKIRQAQALQDLGYYRRANKILDSVTERLSDRPNSKEKVLALLSHGNTLRAVGNLAESLKVLQQAIAIAEELNASEQKNAVLLSLGNTIRALGNRVEPQAISQVDLASRQCLSNSNSQNANAYYFQAADCYQQSALSTDLETKSKAQLGLLNLLISNPTLNSGDKRLTIPDLIADIKANLTNLPVTHTTIYNRIDLVQSLICLQPNTINYPSPVVQQCRSSSKNFPTSWAQVESEVQIALEQAERLQDRSAIAYADGYLGAVYQQTGKLSQAQQLTERALSTINNITSVLIQDSTAAPEIAYRWQWQLGRIYQLQNNSKAALQAYNTAFVSLQSLRTNLIATDPETQFAFRDQIEPLYRERVALLLAEPSQENLLQARDTIEALQISQLNNFFREACFDAQPQEIDKIDRQAAVIYSIILPDRLALILSQPDRPLRYYQTAIEQPEIKRVLDDLNEELKLGYSSPSIKLQPNKTFYDWLIRPLESQLTADKTKTLVFVLDGIMRGIPVAALYDRQENKYLIEKYSLALTPGLQLLTSRSLTPDSLKTIAGGLTESRQGFNSLFYVGEEMSEIARLVPSKILLNENFTKERLRQAVTTLPYPIVHLATHGQFSSRAEDTFLLAWNGRIKVKDLDQLLQDRDFAENTPIELLILSACQTAEGDERAALGLAGVAVRSRARSTLATLWSTNDDSTAELIIQFYRAMKIPGTTKAEALRKAQLYLLKSTDYQDPSRWSAFVLVGNWL